MNFDNINVITVAKVGSSNFLHSLKHKYKKILRHTHSLKYLKDILSKKINLLSLEYEIQLIEIYLTYSKLIKEKEKTH